MTLKKEPSLTLPISSIGKNFKVTLGKEPSAANGKHFATLNTAWLSEFLTEYELSSAEDQRIEGSLVIQQEDSIFRCQAHIEFEPLLECSRCLTRFRQKVAAQGTCFYSNKPFADSSKQHSLSGGYNDEICLTEEDMEAYEYQGNALTLDELVLDILQTNLPEFPVCHDTCRGLCRQCGVNLNEINHCTKKECPTQFVDVH